MAGISVPQHEIFKITTDHLELVDWNLKLNRKDAINQDEVIKLFDSQFFRLMKDILNNRGIKKINWFDYVVSVVISKKSHFDIICEGFKINDNTFKRLVATTGGLKKNTVIFVNEKILDELNERMSSVDIKNKFVPAKYEAYKALTLSSSQEIIEPNGILVVSDCFTKYMDKVIQLDDSIPNIMGEPQRKNAKEYVELENNATDGFNLCTYNYIKKISEQIGLDYITSGVCLRNKWLKGMLYPFPIEEFIEKYLGNNTIVKDIWGNDIDISKVEMILTESSLKLWSSYNSIESYIENCRNTGYRFSITKIMPNELEDYRELNYQYLQSYEFTDEDIEELCKPTIDFLKKSLGGNYKSTLDFLGVDEEIKDMDWKKALLLDEYFLNDPYVLDCIHRLLKKKISDAKMGKLKCKANFQTFSNDPFLFMQHACGLKETGLLKANECYSDYWIDNGDKEILAFRSPMSCHNNIRKLQINKTEECKHWFRYMKNILIVNSYDSFCKAENGEDADGDANFTTNNKILIKKFQNLPAIDCAQKTAKKKNISEKSIRISNKKAFGNDVGSITNHVTSMKEKQSYFEKNSWEYKELEYRIQCGQLYQQNCLDSIKGIVAQPMPKYWYDLKACRKKVKELEEQGMDGTKLLNICADVKPYFMIYRYKNTRKKYKEYIESNEQKALQLLGKTLSELESQETYTEAEENFMHWYNLKFPVGRGLCAMNKIAYHIEKELNEYPIKLKSKEKFDYSYLRYDRRKGKEHIEAIKELLDRYVNKISAYKSNTGNFEKVDKEDGKQNREQLKEEYYNQAKKLVPDDKERMNIILDLCYGENKNKQFCWDTIGDLICNRVKEIKDGENDIE